jgi:thiamine biosynthesis lipoprotein
MLRLYSVLIFGLFLLISCGSETVEVKPYTTLQGKTMGTTYTVKYLDSLGRNFQQAIDQLLEEVNAEVNTYDPQSFISQFNQAEEEVPYLNLLDKSVKAPLHFKANLEKAKEIHKLSYGFFDPTIMPIVNYWGFGYTEKRPVTAVDKVIVDSLINFVGLDKVFQRSAKDGWIYLGKVAPGVQLDFSAIAKGYGVDAVALMLEGQKVANYYVEIGGELRVKGMNPSGKLWKIGINTPSAEASLNDIEATVSLKNESMATSGNYRNYYEVDGVKYAHTINPKTGFPEKNTLLSTTIFAADCMTADGYATACMTLGLEQSKALIESLDNIDAFFLYSDPNGDILSHNTNPARKLENIQE